jgi:hypothetical protein
MVGHLSFGEPVDISPRKLSSSLDFIVFESNDSLPSKYDNYNERLETRPSDTHLEMFTFISAASIVMSEPEQTPTFCNDVALS